MRQEVEKVTLDRCGRPRLVRPVTLERLRAELDVMLVRAGLDPQSATLDLADEISLERAAARGRCEHTGTRRFAQVHVGRRAFEFADETLWLPFRYRIALCAHEVGHVCDPILPTCDSDRGACAYNAVENRADRLAHSRCGIRIGYDHRWPGKGLQVWKP